MKNEQYFILALKLLYLTLRSNTNKKHAAAIIKNNRLLYRRSNFTGMHAEENVLRQMNTKEKLILVIRCEKNILKYSKPCKYCIELMRKKGIKKVVYTTGDVNNPIEIEDINNISNNWTTTLSRRPNLNVCVSR
jgi:pyrimidine deaminase RibD-like protein